MPAQNWVSLFSSKPSRAWLALHVANSIAFMLVYLQPRFHHVLNGKELEERSQAAVVLVSEQLLLWGACCEVAARMSPL